MLTILLTAAWLIIEPQSSKVLDVTTMPELHNETFSGSGCAGGSSGRRPESSNLSIVTVSLDQAEYALGAKFIFDVVLINTAKNTIAFPWNRPGDMVGVTTDSLVEAQVGLSTTDMTGRELHLTGVVLQGSSERRSSRSLQARA